MHFKATLEKYVLLMSKIWYTIDVIFGPDLFLQVSPSLLSLHMA